MSMSFILEVPNVDADDVQSITQRLAVEGEADQIKIGAARVIAETYRVWFLAADSVTGETALNWGAVAAGVSVDAVDLVKSEAALL